MTKRLYYVQVNEFNFDSIIDDAKEKKPDEIVLLGETEWEIVFPEDFCRSISALGVKLRVLHCACPNEYYENLYQSLGLDYANVEFWKTAWFNWADIQITHLYDKNSPRVGAFKYPFITMNNKAHLHRCMFIDELTRIGMLNKGAVTWINSTGNFRYPFKYYDNFVRTFNDGFETNLNSFMIPKEFHQSFFHVVSESTNHVIMFTEKTVIPILFKKPFICLSAVGFHKELRNLGFKLYDELIDYSFDNEPDLGLRTTKFVANIPNIVNCNWERMYEKLRPKLEYNYNRAIELVNDKSRLPKIILDRCSDLKMQLTSDITHDRSLMFLEYTHA